MSGRLKKVSLNGKTNTMATAFNMPSWAETTNIYEVNIRQYTPEGTLQAFMPHLKRLAGMGVETLWFMPLTPIAEQGRKGTLGSYYATKDYTSMNPAFGTIADFKQIVQECHALGMRVIVDWVANHTGLDHHWTISHPEYYLRNASGAFLETHGWEDVIDLNYGNPALHAAMIESMQWWLDTFHIDGFRCDMAHLVPLDFWRQARLHIDATQAHFWLAESEDPSYHEVFDATYTWKWMHATEQFAKQQLTMQALWDLLYAEDSAFPKNAVRLWFTSNHDENTWNGTEYEKYNGLALPLAVFAATWNGIPLIYNGQELPNFKRLKFFDKDQIDWLGQNQLESFYSKLLQFRKSNAALLAGSTSIVTFRIKTANPEQICCFLRQSGKDRVLVLLNFSGADLKVPLLTSLVEGTFKELFTERVDMFTEATIINLEAFGFQVWYGI